LRSERSPRWLRSERSERLETTQIGRATDAAPLTDD
jgi:hypothetical protein